MLFGIIMKVKFIILFFLFILNVTLLKAEQVSGTFFSQLNKEELNKEIEKVKEEPDQFVKYAKLGIIYHFLSEKGVKTAQESVDNLNLALSADKNNYIINAYLGSAYTLLANEKTEKALQLKYANIGIKILDQVYNDNSTDYEINILYISNSIAIPNKLFNRLSNAVEAVDKLLLNIKDHVDEQKAEIYYLKAETLFLSGREPEAIKQWKNIIKQYPNSRYSERAKQRIRKYSE
jgi:tetratricopeptide (TPR) repeat protein